MSDAIPRYPLTWPTGWKRTHPTARQRAYFGKSDISYGSQKADGSRDKVTRKKPLTPADATARLQAEVDRLGGSHAILSTNLQLRIDGVPRSDQRDPADPGAAIYFTLNNKPMCLACDKWDRVADNIAALAQHIDAMRRIDRYGVGTLDQAFAGYAALPPAMTDWWIVLDVSPNATKEQVDEAFKRLAFTAHPDRGGSHDQMARLSEARTAAHKALR